MKRFKRIVATTDLSPESLSTVRYAIHLAIAQNAELAIVHVPESLAALSPEFKMPRELDALSVEMRRAAREKLEKWSKPFSKHLAIRIVVESGRAHDTICRIARRLRADLIVMSTHGRKGLHQVLLGSITNRVLREAPCPVLVVKPGVGAKKPSKPGKTASSRGSRREPRKPAAARRRRAAG